MRILQLMFECGIYSVKALLKIYTVLQRPEHSTREKGVNACPNTCAFFFSNMQLPVGAVDFHTYHLHPNDVREYVQR